jgi:uncharacterized protein (DUF1697 family)
MRYVALLRGINVGGKNKLPMKDLVRVFAAAGGTEVQTYIQSGNVIFEATAGAGKKIAPQVEQRLADRLGLEVPVVVRTAGELVDVVDRSPVRGPATEHLHVAFLAAQPPAGRVAALDPARSPPDSFQVRGREIYLQLPNGAARTKLTNAYFDGKLGTTSTMRNWRTVLALLAMATADR